MSGEATEATWLLDCLTDGVVLVDAVGRVTHVNPAARRLLGPSTAPRVGALATSAEGRLPPAWSETLRQVLGEGGRARLVELRLDGTSPRILSGNVFGAPDGGGALVFQDCTERHNDVEVLLARNQELKAARDELARSNADLQAATQAKARFLATMSHEMRTPLNAILGYVELLNLGVSGELSEGQRQHLSRIAGSGRALLDLINDVLDFTRADAGKLAIETRPLRLMAVVEEAVEMIRPSAAAKGITLRVEPPAEPAPWATGDFRRLRQVLTNLLSNAVKFTRKGAVVVRVGSDDGFAVVSVSDTGIGISADQLPQVFREFYQADSDLTREYGGTGLGLAISQRLANLMGGEITARSEVGRGSAFTLRLPLAVARDEAPLSGLAPEGATPESTRGGAGTEVATVVVFGGDGGSIAALEHHLRPRVRVVGTAQAAVVPELAKRERASLVVLDVAFQGGAGWEAAHEIREDPALDDVAVLLLPCLPQAPAEGTAGALDLGWVAVVPKPFASPQLTRVVSQAAGRAAEDAAPGSWDVLIVDDDPDARRIASQMLSAAGATVREAADGEEGLAEMRRSPPAAAVVDLMMPVLDGFGVLAAMRADPHLRDIPVVVLTAKDLSEAERRFLSRTAETVLEKGVHSLSEVAALIRRAARVPATV